MVPVVPPVAATNDGTFRAPHGTIGNAIKQLRLKRELSQEQLGKKVGVTQSAVASWESGRTCPKVNAAKALADEFNVPLEYILGHRKRLFQR